MPPKKKQKRMSAATDRQTRSKVQCENGSLAQTQEATWSAVESKQEATQEMTEEVCGDKEAKEGKRPSAVVFKEEQMKLLRTMN